MAVSWVLQGAGNPPQSALLGAVGTLGPTALRFGSVVAGAPLVDDEGRGEAGVGDAIDAGDMDADGGDDAPAAWLSVSALTRVCSELPSHRARHKGMAITANIRTGSLDEGLMLCVRTMSHMWLKRYVYGPTSIFAGPLPAKVANLHF